MVFWFFGQVHHVRIFLYFSAIGFFTTSFLLSATLAQICVSVGDVKMSGYLSACLLVLGVFLVTKKGGNVKCTEAFNVE